MREEIKVTGANCRAAVKYGYAPPKKGLLIPKKAGKVAVIGGGISGISAALELDRKGFQVTIYEKSEQLGGRLWDYEGVNLDQGVLEEELQIFGKLDIEVILNRYVS
jgi:glutamate synthase (NADPH/NADH) small chain